MRDIYPHGEILSSLNIIDNYFNAINISDCLKLTGIDSKHIDIDRSVDYLVYTSHSCGIPRIFLLSRLTNNGAVVDMIYTDKNYRGDGLAFKLLQDHNEHVKKLLKIKKPSIILSADFGRWSPSISKRDISQKEITATIYATDFLDTFNNINKSLKCSFNDILNYKLSNKKIKFSCGIVGHGYFFAKPSYQIKCPICAAEHATSDNDVVYIWKLKGLEQDGDPVYKIGITSFRLGNKRINQVAKSSGYKAVNIVKYRVTGKATLYESNLLKIGCRVWGDAFDGCTEIRALNNKEYNSIIKQLSNIEDAHLVA